MLNTPLKCTDMKSGDKFVHIKQLNINEDTAYNVTVKSLESIYSRLDANGRIKLEGHNPHLQLPGNNVKLSLCLTN
jgi:hypothetical protein